MKSTTPIEITARLYAPALIEVFLMFSSVGISAGCLFYELYLKYVKKEPEAGAKDKNNLFPTHETEPDNLNGTHNDMVDSFASNDR